MQAQRPLTIASVVLLLPSLALGAFVDSGNNDAVGNSGFTSGSSLDGWVNFAVYTNNGPTGNWLTDLGLVAGDLASPLGTFGVTGAERNVFFYEITRSSTVPDIDLTSITFPRGEDIWTGLGALDNFVFDEASVGEVVGSTTGANTALGTAAAPGGTSLDGALDGTPFVTPSSTAEQPLTVFLDGSGNAVFTFAAFSGAGTGFLDGEHSTILIATSNSNPLITIPFEPVSTALSGATGGPIASVPVSNPEPGSLALLFVGATGGAAGAFYRRRKRQKGKEVNDTAEPALAV